MSKTIDLFLQYVKIDTQSDESTGTSPSAKKQHNLAGLLVRQLEEMGASEVTYDQEHCYVYASVPASVECQDAPVLGLIAHMDTAPVVSGSNVRPRIVENYDGGDIVLNEEENILFRPSEFEEVALYKGKDRIVTVGRTTRREWRRLWRRPSIC